MSKTPSPAPRKRPTRETFFVRIVTGDGQAAFINASDHIGKPMPFQKPRATLAMSVSDDTIAFSLLHLTAKNAAKLRDRPIEMPRGPIARLNRRASFYNDLTEDELVVELSTRLDAPAPASQPADTPMGLDDLFAPADTELDLDELFAPETPAVDDTPADEQNNDSSEHRRRPQRQSEITAWRCHLRRSPGLLASVETVEDDHVFELPFHPVRATVYLKSPSTGRMIAVSFIGHVGKPGTAESMSRVASKILSSMAHLPEFQLLAGIEGVNLGLAPGMSEVTAPEAYLGKAEFNVRVHMFDDALRPVGSGDVGVAVDLQNANPSSGKLFYRFSPNPAIEDVFAPFAPMLEAAVTDAIKGQFSDDGIAQITYDIVLGGITTETVELLRDAGSALGAIDVAPSQWRPHS